MSSELDYKGKKLLEELTVHEHGFVKLLDVMGDDKEVENAARISYGEGTRKVSQTRNLIRYLMRHRHTSPFEMCEVKFHIKLPIFIMRQLVRHRTANLNEYSGRYSVMSDDFYFPKGKELKPQSTTNKQGREEGELRNIGEIEFEMYRIFDGATNAYHNLLDWNVSRELARIVLPVSNYTEVIWKIDLNNFFKFYQLRGDDHSQKEIQDYANAMWSLVEPHFPLCCEAFSDYVLNAETFSEQEMEIIKDNLNGSWVMSKYGLSERESTEFLEKIGRNATN
jgi:thymidylate synthase (FAD)